MAEDDSFTPGIPDQSNNPFIATTIYPEGTLFIVFGSILGGLAVVVLVWRVVSIWQGRRAANLSDSGISEEKDPATVASYASNESTAKKAKPNRHTTPTFSFFSPTHEAMVHGSMNAPIGTVDGHLPAGYYNIQNNAAARARPPSFVHEGTSSRRSIQQVNNPPTTTSREPKPRLRPPSQYLEELIRTQ